MYSPPLNSTLIPLGSVNNCDSFTFPPKTFYRTSTLPQLSHEQMHPMADGFQLTFLVPFYRENYVCFQLPLLVSLNLNLIGFIFSDHLLLSGCTVFPTIFNPPDITFKWSKKKTFVNSRTTANNIPCVHNWFW